MSFDQYLIGIGGQSLNDAKKKADIKKPLADLLHQKLVEHFKRLLVIGGMPEVIANYIENNDIRHCGQVLDNLNTSLKADFVKHKKQSPFLRISEVLDAVIQQSGNKFTYAKAATEANHKQTVDFL